MQLQKREEVLKQELIPYFGFNFRQVQRVEKKSRNIGKIEDAVTKIKGIVNGREEGVFLREQIHRQPFNRLTLLRDVREQLVLLGAHTRRYTVALQRLGIKNSSLNPYSYIATSILKLIIVVDSEQIVAKKYCNIRWFDNVQRIYCEVVNNYKNFVETVIEVK